MQAPPVPTDLESLNMNCKMCKIDFETGSKLVGGLCLAVFNTVHLNIYAAVKRHVPPFAFTLYRKPYQN